MDIAVNVAYRVYHLESEVKAILFHTKSRQYMFLEGLSAELFEMLTLHDKIDSVWLEAQGLSSHDVEGFIEVLRNFGCYNEGIPICTPNDEGRTPLEEANKTALNRLQNELRNEHLFYGFHIDITNRCNERCIHCYHPFDSYNFAKEMSLEDIQSLIDIIYDLGVFSVTLSGGEALLRPDFFDILSYISGKGMLTTLFTNGTTLTENVVQRLFQYRLNKVSISLYSDITEMHDNITQNAESFSKTMRGIELLKQYDIPFELKCVVLKENADRCEEMRELSKRINDGRDCKIDFSLCGKINGDCSVYEHRVSLEKLRKIFYADPERYMKLPEGEKKISPDDNPCGAGQYALYCSPDGSIYPCVSFRLYLCNYRELRGIHSNKVWLKWRNTKISDFSECFKHDYCDFCTEQCAGNNLIENGDYLNSNITHCDRAKVIAGWYHSHSVDEKET